MAIGLRVHVFGRGRKPVNLEETLEARRRRDPTPDSGGPPQAQPFFVPKKNI